MWIKLKIILLLILGSCTPNTKTLLVPGLERNFTLNIQQLINSTNNEVTNQLHQQLIALQPNSSSISNDLLLNQLNSSVIDLNIFVKIEKPENSFNSIGGVKYLFQQIIEADWQNKKKLQFLANNVENQTVQELLYTLLSKELKNHPTLKHQPFEYIELLKDIKNIQIQYPQSEILQQLQLQLNNAIVIRTSQILQGYFIQNSTYKSLINALHNLQIPNLYENVLQNIFAELEQLIEDRDILMAMPMLFNSSTENLLKAYSQYLNINFARLNDSRNLHYLYNTFSNIISQPDFSNISPALRKNTVKYLPLPLTNLWQSNTICFRHFNGSYLTECPQTYLMCTNSFQKSRSTSFSVQRLGFNEFAFFSEYWSNYLRLEHRPLNNGTSIAAGLDVVKNIYSRPIGSKLEIIAASNNHVRIYSSATQEFICAGNARYWSKFEKYAYTKLYILANETECLWTIEDCSVI